MDAKLKQRRTPYGRGLPAEIAENGYVRDLVAAVSEAASGHGAQVSFHKKNDDYYISVLIPAAAELAEMERSLDEHIAKPAAAAAV